MFDVQIGFYGVPFQDCSARLSLNVPAVAGARPTGRVPRRAAAAPGRRERQPSVLYGVLPSLLSAHLFPSLHLMDLKARERIGAVHDHVVVRAPQDLRAIH